MELDHVVHEAKGTAVSDGELPEKFNDSIRTRSAMIKLQQETNRYRRHGRIS